MSRSFSRSGYAGESGEVGSPATGGPLQIWRIFYRYAMTFEEFVPAFSGLPATGVGVAVLTGVRADESLNRFMGLVSQRKLEICR